MFVGIMCACMPAAAHTYNHHAKSYSFLKKNFRLRYGLLGVGDRGTNPPLRESTFHDVKTSRAVHEGYVTLDAPGHSTRMPAKPLQTFVSRVRCNDLDHEDIHLTHEMQHVSASPQPQDHQWTAA